MTADADPSNPFPSLTEHGPSLLGGIVTVDDASFTTRIKIHSGPTATIRYRLITLLDTGSRQTFITAEVWARMKTCGAATTTCERHAAPRAWGGFGKTAPLLTSTSVLLSVQFLQGDNPSAELAVWARILPPGTMHPVLGRDSWMLFEQRTYTTMPRQPPQPTFGELSLCTPFSDGLSTFIQDDRLPDDVYHLRYAGREVVSLTSTPSLVQVNLVRSSGMPALTGNYLVDMLHRDDLSSDSEIFVAHRQQHIPLGGFTDLEPGDLLGTSSSPLTPLPRSALQDPSTEHPPTPPTSDVHALHDKIPVATDATSPTDAPSPPKTTCPKLLECLDDSQRVSFLHIWDRLPLHLRHIKFDLHSSGGSPAVINALGDVRCEFPDVFSTSKTDFGSCSLIPFKIFVPPDSAPVPCRPYRINPILAKKTNTWPLPSSNIRPPRSPARW